MDKVTGKKEDVKLTKINSFYNELSVKTHGRCWRARENLDAWMVPLSKRVRKLKKSTVCVSDDHCQDGLSTMNFRL